MIRGTKDEEKGMSPMFPRLHVKDAEKGGPRAPPRNKMALYEQLSIPSQRFSSGSAPLLPLPPTNSSSLVPSTSSSHNGNRRRVMLTSFCKSPSLSHGAEKLTSYSSTLVKLTDMPKEETKSSSLRISRPLSSDYKWDMNEENDVSKLRNFFSEKTRDEDEVRVPISAQAPHLNNGKTNRDGDSASVQFQTPSEPHLTGAGSMDFRSRQMATGQAGEDKKTTPTNQRRAEESADVAPSKLENSKHINHLAESSGHEISSFCDNGEKNASIQRGKSCLTPPLDGDKRNESKPEEDENCVSVHPKHQVISVMNSGSANIICPDDIVGAIGEKQFWDARKAIISQQRIFAVQVFELHRVIKVQRLIAESPHLLLEGDLDLKKSAMKVPLAKKLPTENALQPLPLSCTHKDQNRKPISLPSCNSDAFKGLVTNQAFNDLHSRNTPQASMATNAKPEPWCFTPLQASQWLVPVMSPSEGLIYKPFAGLCPPSAGFMAPNYGMHRPPNMISGNVDFLNAAYGVPASDKQGVGIPSRTPPLNHAYFPPYSLPVTHQSLSCSAVEQTCAITRSNGPDNQASVGEINNYTARHKHSHNMSSQTSRIMTCQAEKVQGLKGSELQGSTASSHMAGGGGNRDALPLFPMAPTVEESDQNTETSKNNRSRVIKVVPHNPRTATESAARIFQLIQEERKQI